MVKIEAKPQVEQLEDRENPSLAVPEAFVGFMPGYDGPLAFTAGDVDGNGLVDTIGVAAEGGGGSVRVVVRSGGTPGLPPVIGPDGVGYDPTFAQVIHDKVYFDEDFRGGGVVSSLRAPSGDYSLLVISPGQGGGPLVAFVDLMREEVTVKVALDINYRGGLRFTQLPPLDGVGYPDSLILATPAPGGGGGPVATIFDGNGEFLRSFYVGPVG
jgi:hypothetical protein